MPLTLTPIFTSPPAPRPNADPILTPLFTFPQGVTVLQLFPYGWQQPSGEVLRESLYSQMTLFKRGNYLRWVNPHPHNAFFRR